MSHPHYKDIGPVEIRPMEEAAELIQAVAKAARFGWGNRYLDRKETNRELVLLEMVDILFVWNELAKQQVLPRIGLMDAIEGDVFALDAGKEAGE